MLVTPSCIARPPNTFFTPPFSHLHLVLTIYQKEEGPERVRHCSSTLQFCVVFVWGGRGNHLGHGPGNHLGHGLGNIARVDVSVAAASTHRGIVWFVQDIAQWEEVMISSTSRWVLPVAKVPCLPLMPCPSYSLSAFDFLFQFPLIFCCFLLNSETLFSGPFELLLFLSACPTFAGPAPSACLFFPFFSHNCFLVLVSGFASRIFTGSVARVLLQAACGPDEQLFRFLSSSIVCEWVCSRAVQCPSSHSSLCALPCQDSWPIHSKIFSTQL